MRRDVRNWPELVEAVREMEPSISEARLLIFHDPGGLAYSFLFGEHGLTKVDSDWRGNELYPERSRHTIFGSEDE